MAGRTRLVRGPALPAVLAVLLVTLVMTAVPAASAAPKAARAGRATPALLDEAVARGEIDRSRADEHLVEVFVGRGRSGKVPARFQSDVPWDGTLPLLRLKQRLSAEPATTTKARTEVALAAVTNCMDSTAALPNETTSARFYVAYGTIGGGLSISSYLATLEATWTKQVTTFGWAAPPSLATPPPAPIGTRYPVRIDTLGGGLYGFVSTDGTGAGFRGDNPNTAWNDQDAYASCMVLNNDYSAFPGTAQQALDATVAHEFNHSIQFGYGAIDGTNVPDDLFFEGGATWMEDETFDASNDNYGYLWPDFGDSLGDYDGSPYETWIFLRGLTERFGSGTAGGGEQVMQTFWEATSQNAGNNLSALAAGLATKGITLADAYHDFAVGTGFLRTCGGGYALPYCYEEAAGYLASVGLPPVAGSIPAVGGSFSGSVEDDYALAWVTLPTSGNISLTLNNTSAGGQLRATAVCDTGTTLVRSPFPAVVGGGTSTTLASFAAGGCVRTMAVITNQQQSPGNPDSSPTRSFTLTSGTGSARVGAVADFDGNGTTDRSVYRSGGWYVQGQPTAFFGLSGDVPVPADYDGNRDTERAVFRNGAWYVEGQPTVYFGVIGDIPVPGDYDGNGDAERAVFRPSTGGWYVEGLVTVSYGALGDFPVPGDYDGNGTTDRAVFRNGAWYVQGQPTVFWGVAGDIPVPGDYDGNGTTDRAVFRSGGWYVHNQATMFFGLAGDVPMPGDYDGNGTTDRTVYRNGAWYTSGQGTVFFGLAGDIPLPLPYAIRSRIT